MQTNGFLYDGSSWTILDASNAPVLPVSFVVKVQGISGTNIVGYGYDSSGVAQNVPVGFLYDPDTWTTLKVPGAAGTFAEGVAGVNVVGYYQDTSGFTHGFFASPIPALEITQSADNVNLSWPYLPITVWTLHQNSDLSTTNWTAVPTSALSNDGTNNFMPISQTNGNLFFRLGQQ